MDAEVLIHIVATYFDLILPPVVDAPSASPAAAAASTSMFGTTKGFGAVSANPFGGGLPGALPTKVAEKQGVFWRSDAELTGFSTRHLGKAWAKQRVKSDVVLLQHHVLGSGTSAGDGAAAAGDGQAAGRGTPRAGPRYSLMCDGVEWVVALGEHNAWEALVLLFFHRAKRGGFLGGVDLRQELFTSFQSAATSPGAAQMPPVESSLVRHGLLTILHPWSQRLEDLNLTDVAQALD